MKPVHEQLKELFLRTKSRAMCVRDIIDVYPRLNRATVSKKCLYMAMLGMLTASMVDNYHHGRRYLFVPTPLLLSAKHMADIVSPRSLIVTILKHARRSLNTADLRYAINSLFGCNVTKRAVQAGVDQLVADNKVMKDGGHSRKYQRYALGREDAAPWRVLDVAFRGMEATRATPRRLISQGSELRQRKRLRPPR